MTSELQGLVDSGVILPRTKVWGEQLEDWTAFEDCKAKFGLSDLTTHGPDGSAQHLDETQTPLTDQELRAKYELTPY